MVICFAMEIVYLGHSSFLLRGKSARVVCDPFDSSMVGLKFPKVEASLVTISHGHGDHNFTSSVAGVEGKDPFIINGPGEYEVGGVSVFGIGTFHDASGGSERGKNTVYVIEVDGVKICHLGDLGHKLSDEQVRAVGEVDVLLVPVGGFYTIDAKTASEVVAQLEPRIVIPMHYKVSGLIENLGGKISTAEEFLKEMGAGSLEPQPKLVVTKDKLPDQVQVVLLSSKTS